MAGRKGQCWRAVQVLFDTLKFHGASFTAPFWARVFDSVLLPIFDHVRAEVRPTLPPLRMQLLTPAIL